MVESLLTLFKYSSIFLFLLPFMVRILPRGKDKTLLFLVLSIGISLGIGSYFLFLLYFFKINPLFIEKVYLIYLSIFILGLLINLKSSKFYFNNLLIKIRKFKNNFLTKNYFKQIFLEPFGIIKIVILIFSLYVFLLSPFFPLAMWDDLVRYGAWASQIFSRGEIGNQINSYPLMVTMLYVYGFLVSGFRNDYLIKLIPFAYGCLTLLLTYIVANDIFNKRKDRGVIAVFFLLCFVPFIDWWHLGYVDIASSFYYLATFYSLYLFCKNRKTGLLLLTGIFLGLSLWCKQQTLLLYGSILLVYGVLQINRFRHFIDTTGKLHFKDLFIIIFLSLTIIVPWYIRDFLIVGTPLQVPVFESRETFSSLILPFVFNADSVGYYAAALFQIAFVFSLLYVFKISRNGFLFNRKKGLTLSILFTISPLLVFLIKGHPFISGISASVSIILFFAGLYLLFYYIILPKKEVVSRYELRYDVLFLLLFILPYYLIWWLKFPMVFRYLLTIAPLFSLLFVFFADLIIKYIEKIIQKNVIAKLFVTIVLVSFVSIRLGDVFNLKDLQYFFINSETKNLTLAGEAYPVGTFLQTLPAIGNKRLKIISTDNRLAYFAPEIDFYNIAPAYLSDLIDFDYFILNPWTLESFELRKKNEKEIYFNLINENPKVFNKVFELGEYKIYKILVTKLDFTNSLPEKLDNQDKPKEKIMFIKSVYIPKTLPGNSLYRFKVFNDQLTIWGDRIFYNGSQQISLIANKRLLEAYEICLYQNKCDLAGEALTQFKVILASLRVRINASDRIVNDGNFYIMQDLQNSFEIWFSILRLLSENNSSISPLAQQVMNDDLKPLIEDFYTNVVRKEPMFSYYNKDGEYLDEKNK